MTRTQGFFAVMLSAFFFGLMPLLAKTVCAAGGNTVGIAFYRFFIALFPLFAYLKWKKIPLRISARELRQIILLSACGYGGTALMLYLSYDYIPSGMATTIHFVYPAFVILGSVLFLKEKVGVVKLRCVALCMGGILLFYGGGTAGGNLLGLAFAFCSGMTYAFYVLYLSHSGLQSMPALKLIFYMNIVASALLLGGSLATGRFFWTLRPHSGWVVLSLLAVGAAFVGVCLFQKGVEVVGSQNAAIFSTLEPITSLIVGVLFYQEAFGVASAIGCAMILASVVIVARLKDTPVETAAP